MKNNIKVAFFHNTYQQRGGEDTVLENEIKSLNSAGIQTLLYTASNDTIGWRNKPFVFLSAIFSFKHLFKSYKFLKENKPSVVHVHNFFPLISPSIFFACRILKIPTVLTLHNYRIICPSATFYINGEVRTESLANGPWWAVTQKAYRNSFAGTLSVALMIWLHKSLGTWSLVSRFITLTDFQKNIFTQFGLPECKITTIPNFVKNNPSACPEDKSLPEKFVLYAGRLSLEKGVDVLVEAAKHSEYPIVVVGSGPDLEVSKIKECSKIIYLKSRSPSEVKGLMNQARSLVIPSLWFEGLPMVVVEAYSVGLPVIASDIGSLSEVVINHHSGLLFPAKNHHELSKAINIMCEDDALFVQMSNNAKEHFFKNFTEEKHIQGLTQVYRELLKSNEENHS